MSKLTSFTLFLSISSKVYRKNQEAHIGAFVDLVPVSARSINLSAASRVPRLRENPFTTQFVRKQPSKAGDNTTTYNTAWLNITRIPCQKQDLTVCAAGMTWKLPHTLNTEHQSIQNGYHLVIAWVSWQDKTHERLRRHLSCYLSGSVKKFLLHSLHRSVAEEPMEYLHIGAREDYLQGWTTTNVRERAAYKHIWCQSSSMPWWRRSPLSLVHDWWWRTQR